MLARLLTLLGEASGTTLAFTGILGLAAVLYTLYQLRGSQGRKPDEPGASQRPPHLDPTQPSTSAAGGAAAAAAAAAVPKLPGAAAAVSPAAAVARRLAGVRCITLSLPGVLLEESSPAELEESASLHAGAADLLREVASQVPGVYLMCHISDDIGEAVVRGALEHAGLLGSGRGQVPPHRVLFCGTLDGKVSLVRQLEPDLHFDGHEKTVSDLQRFVKQLVLVQPPGAAGSSAAAAGNVQLSPSLGAALGLA